MLVDQPQAIELTRCQAVNAVRKRIAGAIIQGRPITVRQIVRVFQANPHLAQYGAYSRATSLDPLLGHS